MHATLDFHPALGILDALGLQAVTLSRLVGYNRHENPQGHDEKLEGGALPVSDAGNQEHSRARRQRLMAESSVELLAAVQSGDEVALDVLCARYLPPLERWATGRLPHGARDLLETGDIVQETVVRSLRKLDRFEHQREGAILAYLRTAIMNRIRDEARRVERRPMGTELEPERHVMDAPSPLESLIGRESIEIYERSLELLSDSDREAVVARLEMGMSFEEIAQMLGKGSANTARMTFNRALARLAEEMTRATG